MKNTYQITGMTCNGCRQSVENTLAELSGVTNVTVSLANNEAEITSEETISITTLQNALPTKYTLSAKKKELNLEANGHKEQSKLQQLRPLLLIFTYIGFAAVLLNANPWKGSAFMLDFMGLFYIVFSFFKLLDLKGFPASFRMYDPLAKVVPFYGWMYPFIEIALGLMFLMRFQINVALIITLVVLGITTIGVTKTLLDKKTIRCACLGTALKLPMTEATFIENLIMMVMAVWMLFF